MAAVHRDHGKGNFAAARGEAGSGVPALPSACVARGAGGVGLNFCTGAHRATAGASLERCSSASDTFGSSEALDLSGRRRRFAVVWRLDLMQRNDG
jgi:hypothetical protein